MLKLALIENLRRLAEELLVGPRGARRGGPRTCRGPTTHATSKRSRPARTRRSSCSCSTASASTASACRRSATAVDEDLDARGRRPRRKRSAASTSGRASRRCRWRTPSPACGSARRSTGSEYVESVSLVEQVLQRDPAGAYGRMDFLSRDAQRRAVEELAEPSGEGQVRVALKAIESARQAAARTSTADRAAHVGYHLVDRGRRDLEADLALPAPRWSTRARRALLRHASLLYLGAIATLTALFVAAAVAYAAARRRVRRPPLSPSRCSSCCRRATSRSRACSARRSALVPPKRLPRLDFSTGVPETARTMVIVPTMLTSAAGVDALLEHVEVLALGNLDPCIHFAILSDFADTSTCRRARRRGDSGAGARRASRRSTSSSARSTPIASSCSTAIGSGTRGERRVDRLGAEARQDRGVQPAAARRDGHELLDAGRRARRAAVGPLLHHARLRHAPAARRRQAAHRHHRASAEPAAVRSPARARHRRLRHPAAARQRDDGERGRIAVRAHLRRPHRRRPVHDGRLRRLPGSVRRGDLHRQGAVRRRRVRRGARGPRARERAAVARSVRGALRAHGAGHRRRGRGRLSVERARARAAAAPLGARRLADSVVAVSVRAVAHRAAAQSPAAHRALEDSRQPAAQPAAAGDGARCSCSAGRSCRARRWSWTAMALGGAGVPDRRPRCSSLRAGRAATSRGAASCATASRISKTDAARAGLQLAFMANEAVRAAARDRRSRSSASASRGAACSNGKRRRRARRAAAPVRLRRVRHAG